MTTASEFRSSLKIAASRKQQFGATQSQIDYIVNLSTNDDGSVDAFECNALTKFEASAIIDNLLNPAQTPTKEEVAKYTADTKEKLADSLSCEAAAKEWKATWISENHPDYENRSKKSRKNIRAKANKAYAG